MILNINLFYSKLSENLLEKLSYDKEYFSGTVDCHLGPESASLVCTIIVYRQKSDDQISKIENIVPIWWEFNTYIDGVKSDNDMSWSEFKQFLEDGYR